MVAISYLDARRPLHPLHAILLSIPLPLFIGALICDVAYSRTWHVQWGNFSSWLIAGALVGCGLALLWALGLGSFPGLLFGLLLSMPLSFLVLRGVRERLTEAMAARSTTRRAAKEELRARLAGTDGPAA